MASTAPCHNAQHALVLLIGWRSLMHSRRRFVATVVGLAFAVLLVVVQVGLLQGFVEASEQLVTRSGADLVVLPVGVSALEYSSGLDVRIGDGLLGIPGVAAVAPVTTGFAEYQHGRIRRGVTLIGMSRHETFGFPYPAASRASASSWAAAFSVDRTSAETLGLESPGDEVEINGRRAVLSQWASGYATYLGSPYLFVDVEFARRVSQLGPERAHFLFVKLAPGARGDDVARAVEARSHGLAVMSADAFASTTSRFWLLRTGAGAALLVSAILGLLVGVVLVAQNLYSGTVERLREYAMLRAIGLARGDVARVVLSEAWICGAAGASLGSLASLPAILLVERVQAAWITTPYWAAIGMVGVGTLTAVAAGVAASRKALSVDPVSLLRGA